MKFLFICGIILVCLLPKGVHGPPVYAVEYHTEEKINKECDKYNQAKLLKAIIKVESNYDPKAVSKKGCLGLMQVNPKVWTKELIEIGIINSKRDLFKVEKNIEAGDYILTKYRKKSSLQKALTNYSGGDKRYYKKVMKEVK